MEVGGESAATCNWRRQTDPNGIERGLGSAGDAQLIQNMANMALDGLLGDVQCLGDFLVGLALRQQPQHLRLTLGQRLSDLLRRAHLVHQSGGCLRGQLHLTGCRSLDGPTQFV